MGAGFDAVGDVEEMGDMVDYGRAQYGFDDTLNRFLGSMYAGTGGGQMAEEGLPQWGAGSGWHGTGGHTWETQVRQVNRAMFHFTQRMKGASRDINNQFFSMLGGIQIDDGGYLEASDKTLAKITQNIEEATGLLSSKNKPIRTMGDLTRAYTKEKRKRQRAISTLSVDAPGGDTTVSYRDPITGKQVTHAVGQLESASDRIGLKNTNAYQGAYDYITRRIGEQQAIYDNLVVQDDWILDNQLSQLETGQDFFGNTTYRMPLPVDEDGNSTWMGEAEATEWFRWQNPYSYRMTALNEFFGGSGETHQFFQEGSDDARALANNLFHSFATVAGGTYGNLYDAAFNSVGSSLLQSEMTARSVDETKTLMADQVAAAEEQQKKLRKSVSDMTEVFHKNKRKLSGSKRKTPKARFKGFRKDTPE
tara:strand:- start:35598 stop:36857 length:1260 start_codon:yes stop_codon:yes gene_type:complete